MYAFIISVLVLGLGWEASAFNVTAYSDAQSCTPDSGCKSPLPAGGPCCDCRIHQPVYVCP
jgi:hypothetical protein